MKGMVFNLDTLKQRLRSGQTCVGTFIVCNAPDLVEIAALSGFDFVVIDNEHGPMGTESSQHLIRAADLHKMAAILRIPDFSEGTVLHALDVGASGIQVPQINSAQAARELARRAKYPPDGTRGTAFPRAARYGVDLDSIDEYFRRANDETLVVAHCESESALDEIDGICAVPGIDVIFLGPYDMSASMGIAGQVTHPKIERAAQMVLAAAEKHGIAVGIFCADGNRAAQLAAQGFRYIAIGMDTTLYAAKCAQELALFRENAKGKKS